MNTKKDYLAIILVGAGSSYARGPDRQDCIERVKRMVVLDWSSLFDVAGKPATVNVVEAGDDRVWWDARGVYAEDAQRRSRTLDVEQVEVTLPSLEEARA